MQQIKFRTYEEAQKLVLPKTSKENVTKARNAIAFVLEGNASRHVKLKAIYEAADAIVAEVTPLSVCSKGCNHCCKIDVGVTEIEANYIEKNVGQAARPSRTRTTGYAEAGTPCTFLSEEGSCSIYAYRPFACRTFLSFDSPEYCADISATHSTYDPRGNPILIDLGKLMVRLNNAGNYRDIRDFFPKI